MSMSRPVVPPLTARVGGCLTTAAAHESSTLLSPVYVVQICCIMMIPEAKGYVRVLLLSLYIDCSSSFLWFCGSIFSRGKARWSPLLPGRSPKSRRSFYSWVASSAPRSNAWHVFGFRDTLYLSWHGTPAARPGWRPHPPSNTALLLETWNSLAAIRPRPKGSLAVRDLSRLPQLPLSLQFVHSCSVSSVCTHLPCPGSALTVHRPLWVCALWWLWITRWLSCWLLQRGSHPRNPLWWATRLWSPCLHHHPQEEAPAGLPICNKWNTITNHYLLLSFFFLHLQTDNYKWLSQRYPLRRVEN